MFEASEIHIVDDVPGFIAGYVEAKLRRAVGERDGASLVLAGGSTYRETYRFMAGEQLSWENIEIFFGDERQVPLVDERSNYRAAAEILSGAWNADLVHIPDNLENYERAVERYLGEHGQFDVCLLGMGSDGHTASLFPGNAVPEGLVASVKAGQEPFVPRLTLTPLAINRSHLVIVAATGHSKADIVRQIIDDTSTFPVSWIKPNGKKLLVLDPAAASNISM